MALSTPLRNRLPSSTQRQAADHLLMARRSYYPHAWTRSKHPGPGRIIPSFPPLRHLRVLQPAHYGDFDPTHGWLATR